MELKRGREDQQGYNKKPRSHGQFAKSHTATINNAKMHPNNFYKDSPPDFSELALKYESFRP